MSIKEIKAHYAQEIEKAQSSMDKNLLKAEMNHKIKVLELGIDPKAGRDASQFECIGCGS